jgi:hypothetical protein
MGHCLRGWLMSVVAVLGSTGNACPFSPPESAQTGTQVGLSRLNATIKVEPIILKVGVTEYQRTGYVYKRWVEFGWNSLLEAIPNSITLHFTDPKKVYVAVPWHLTKLGAKAMDASTCEICSMFRCSTE